MPMFQLSKQSVKILDFNPRMEKHGDENVLAGDLKIEATVHSGQLDHFDPQMRKFLYRKPAPGEQVELPLNGSDSLTALRLPKLSPFKWAEISLATRWRSNRAFRSMKYSSCPMSNYRTSPLKRLMAAA